MEKETRFNDNPGLARELDTSDLLAVYKKEFCFPQHDGKDVIYFCGNSLGLLPKRTKHAFEIELNSWSELAVGSYFKGVNPWLRYHDYCKPVMCNMMGCSETELTVMNALTVNLHLLMQSFYRPTSNRYKIIMEAGAFPSDQYAVETQVRQYAGYLGITVEDAIIEVSPRNGEKLLRTEDIIAVIDANAESLALVLFSGIQYYTGQYFDMPAITNAAHKAGAVAGFDLAHVAGNIPVKLHDWNIDFAVWCSYKYLNGGPGAVGGIYIHERHARNTDLPRLGGWWGNDENTRFKMEKGFLPKPDVNGWCLSTSQVFNTIALKASLEIFGAAGIERLREKSIRLTAYLEYLLQQLNDLNFEIVSPGDPAQRGAQLSLYFKERGREIHDRMHSNGIVVDYREPGVIRVAPAPLYCSFTDVYRFFEILCDDFNM